MREPARPGSCVGRAVAAIGLAVSSPVLFVAAVSIRLSSPGPVLYMAKRVGLHGVEFTMFKLRTMHENSDLAVAITAGADPRIFRAGAWLRRLKVDEIPQLANVVRGEMVFFGPRPESPSIVARDYRPWMHETLTVHPGLVGPGSLGYFEEEYELPADAEAVEAYYSRVLLPRKLARDLVYIRSMSTRYRIELLARTLLGIIGLDSLMSGWRECEDAMAQKFLDRLERSR